MNAITKFDITCRGDIYQALKDIETTIRIPAFTPYKADHVFDEDQTVRWNREQVQKKNDELKMAINDARSMRSASYAALYEATIQYIMNEPLDDKFSHEVAELILNQVKSDHDNYWEYLDNYIDFAENLRKEFCKK